MTISVLLANDEYVSVPEPIKNFRGLDSEGDLVFAMDFLDDDGNEYLYALTSCCNASGKGASVTTGVVCRACYTEVDSYYGGPAEVAIPRADN